MIGGETGNLTAKSHQVFDVNMSYVAGYNFHLTMVR